MWVTVDCRPLMAESVPFSASSFRYLSTPDTNTLHALDQHLYIFSLCLPVYPELRNKNCCYMFTNVKYSCTCTYKDAHHFMC